ncbi:XRE family transcriptional regulator [Mesorhizobium muleiense]|uniref:XRE family transcriptional regulator n=1 Tax=Mesorhizobium muleiense TaxID=1004279 RepID=UPI001F3F06EB|nr:XRE family transcriptional regulator [Mesorhizobium muleiense]MCF6117111.1 XRE family transcriptional regulator [Mesorhizobium muleiense]
MDNPTKRPIALFIEQCANASDNSYEDIAVMAGFTKASIIYMFISGEAKVPLDCVPALAGALGCDATHLFVLALQQYFTPELFEQIRELVINDYTPNERAWIQALRGVSGRADPELTPQRLKRLREILLD